MDSSIREPEKQAFPSCAESLRRHLSSPYTRTIQSLSILIVEVEERLVAAMYPLYVTLTVSNAAVVQFVRVGTMLLFETAAY